MASACGRAMSLAGLALLATRLASALADLSELIVQDTRLDSGRNSLQQPLLPKVNHGQSAPTNPQDLSPPAQSSLYNLLDSLDVMQGKYFEIWRGTWPDSIDWTGAVLGTHVSATLNAFTTSKNSLSSEGDAYSLREENTVNNYFSHLISYYFGEDFFSLRGEAYDDMLWVVLGWLEGVKFISTHSDTHFSSPSDSLPKAHDPNATWYARSFIPAFAHRARTFYEAASHGWDTTLCSGGMIWSPYLTPYKNAITNELFIAASINMYLYFPGDNNSFPYYLPQSQSQSQSPPTASSSSFTPLSNSSHPHPPGQPHNKAHLTSALSAYHWLQSSNMINARGLYIDGFHISTYPPPRHPHTNSTPPTLACDEPNHMVYTYNQGVLLTGQRGLYLATGNISFLADGHKLIRSVIAATGWDIEANNGTGGLADEGKEKWVWKGLGRAGVLEEACDVDGRCSQNGQTFKGIFFHHLGGFCEDLPEGGHGVIEGVEKVVREMHKVSCRRYWSWVVRNAGAAMGTRDEEGRVGEWWTVGLEEERDGGWDDLDGKGEVDGVDYRNEGIPDEDEEGGVWKQRDGEENGRWWLKGADRVERTREGVQRPRDPNTRGRGRTVETQSGGVAVLRALHLFERLREDTGEKEGKSDYDVFR